MKIAAVKKLYEEQNIDSLRAAEDALLNEQLPTIEVEGEDEGEKLTHVFAAIWVKERMEKGDTDFNKALREFTQKVRNSIS